MTEADEIGALTAIAAQQAEAIANLIDTAEGLKILVISMRDRLEMIEDRLDVLERR